MAPPDAASLTAKPGDSELEQLLRGQLWAEAVHAARQRLASDPRDVSAWAGLARSMLVGLREPEAAYTAFSRALALQQQQQRGSRSSAAGSPSAQDLAARRLECLSAVARADSNAVRARWQRSGLGLGPAPPQSTAKPGTGVGTQAGAGSGALHPSGGTRGGDCCGSAGAGSSVGDGSATRFGEGSSPRVFVLSDLHADTAAAGPLGLTRGSSGSYMELLRRISTTRFQQDVLLVAGDVADTLPATREALRLLKEHFGRVFYVPGNHCLWLRPGLEAGAEGAAEGSSGSCASFPDSLAKLWALWSACDDLGVETVAAEVAPGLAVVPLLSWYNAAFDLEDPRPGRYRFDSWCRWPVSDLDVWQVMLRLNDATLAHMDRWRRQQQQQEQQQQGQHKATQPAQPVCTSTSPASRSATTAPEAAATAPCSGSSSGSLVITLSHFLPHPSLPFPRGHREMAKGVGCSELMVLLDCLQSAVHVYGHTHIPYDSSLEAPSVAVTAGGCARGVSGTQPAQPARQRRYVHWPLQGQDGAQVVLRCIWDGESLCCEDVGAGE